MGSVTEYIKSVCIQPTLQYPQQARYRNVGELIGRVVTDDLQTAVLWTSNKIGFGLQEVEGDIETPRLWSSLPVIVKTGNMSIMPEILRSARMQGLKKLIIKAPLSEKVSHTIVRPPGLREINFNSMLGVDPGLLAKAVTKLETLKVGRKLTKQQAEAILTAVIEGSKLSKLEITQNSLLGVDPGLLAKAVTKRETLHIKWNKLTEQQCVAILTTVSEGSKLTKLHISGNNHTFLLLRPESQFVNLLLLAKVVTNWRHWRSEVQD